MAGLGRTEIRFLGQCPRRIARVMVWRRYLGIALEASTADRLGDDRSTRNGGRFTTPRR